MHHQALLNGGQPIHRPLIIGSHLDGLTESHPALSNDVVPKALTRTLLP
jgi:hypothetical protein